MGLVTKFVEVKWHSKTKQRYVNKGYYFTKMTDVFQVKVQDLTRGSSVRIKCICDCCNKELDIAYCDYIAHVRDDNKYYCKKCAYSLFAKDNINKTKLKNSISFKQWCYNNLSKEKSDEIMQRWDYEKNACSPDEITYASKGIDGKGYWFRCLKHNHLSELKNIQHYVSGLSDLKCIQCNTLVYTHPELAKYLVDKNDAYKYPHSTHTKLLCKCLDCGYEKSMRLTSLINQGYGCPKCSDGVSYPEKFVFAILEQLNIRFKTQYSKVDTEWCENYKYDFYLTDYNSIIEVHGGIHYHGWNHDDNNLEFQVKNDKTKQEIALINGVSKYIIIDARYSTLEWMKKSIIKSELNNLFVLNNIDWDKCDNHAISNFTKQACELWNSGMKSTNEIAKIMKLDRTTIVNYLNRGTKIGLCNYNPRMSCSTKVICLNTDEVFNRIVDANKIYNISRTSISLCCRNKRKSAGVHPTTGEPMRWRYFEEYEKLNSASA